MSNQSHGPFADNVRERKFDREKGDLEKEKLRLEILELKRPWYKKPAYLFPLIAVIFTILTGFATEFFQAQYIRFENQQHDLHQQTDVLNEQQLQFQKDRSTLDKRKAHLEQDRRDVDTESSQLRADEGKLKFQQKELSSELRGVQDERDKVSAEADKLQEERGSLEGDYQRRRAEIDDLNRQYEAEKEDVNRKILDTEQRLVVVPVQDAIGHLATSDKPGPSIQYTTDSLIDLLQHDQADQPRRLAVLRDALHEATDPLIQGQLLYVLFIVTKHDEWREGLFKLARSGEVPLNFWAMLMLPGWNGSAIPCALGITIAKRHLEKGTASTSGRAEAIQKTNSFLDSQYRTFMLQPCGQMSKPVASPDDLGDPQLLLDGVTMARDLALQGGPYDILPRSSGLNALYFLCRPAAYVTGIVVLKSFHVRNIGKNAGSNGAIRQFAFPQDNALALAFEANKLTNNGAAESPDEWLQRHQRLVKLWMENDLATLRSNPSLIELSLETPTN